MEEILKDFNIPGDPHLLVGIDTRDDAGVYKLRDDLALIQTMDFFTPMVDDPYVFGQIAAANAINDVYAMGGKPLLAMNLVCYPECEDLLILRDILAGGLDKIKEAEALLVGGHTVDDMEPKYGLSVTGIVHPDKLLTNSGAQEGDLLFLTKPIGNGVIATAIKAEMVKPHEYEEAIHFMTMLNKKESQVMQSVGVNAVTDVTGFGLIGHLFEMAYSSDVAVELLVDNIPFMQGVLDHASMGLIPGGAYRNRDYLSKYVETNESIDPVIRDLLYSPETAGGLIIAVSKEKAEELVTAMKNCNALCVLIGKVVKKGFAPIKFIKS